MAEDIDPSRPLLDVEVPGMLPPLSPASSAGAEPAALPAMRRHTVAGRAAAEGELPAAAKGGAPTCADTALTS